MKFNGFMCLLFCLLLPSVSTVAIAGIGVAATVQGKQIKEIELQRAIESHLHRQGTNVGAIRDPRRYKVIREKILDVLIGQKLLWQAAENDKTIASEEEVNRAYEQFKAQFKDEMSFDIKLKEGGLNIARFRENLKHQLSVQLWIKAHVVNDLQVTDSDVHDFYTGNKQQFIEPEKVRARHILLQIKSGASSEEEDEAKRLLAGIKKELDSGASFEALAKQRSQDASAAKGGDLGYFVRGQMVKPFEKVAFNLKPGETSDVFKTRFGLHLIKVVDVKPAAQIEEDRVAENIRFYLMRQKQQEAIDAEVIKLKQAATIVKRSL